MLRLINRLGRKSIAALAKRYGYALSPVRCDSPRASSWTAVEAYQRVSKRDHRFKTVIDIGASDGRWSAEFMQWFPDQQYLLIEAQPVHRDGLGLFCASRDNAEFVLAAAGERRGELYFDATKPLGGLASHTPFPQNCITVPVTTVDDEVSERDLLGPFLLKFDTHGFETPILKGAEQTLKRAELIIMECYNFKIAPECLRFHEMCGYFAEKGFRCIDLYDPLYRPRDGVFWHMDLVFAREDRPEFRHPDWD